MLQLNTFSAQFCKMHSIVVTPASLVSLLSLCARKFSRLKGFTTLFKILYNNPTRELHGYLKLQWVPHLEARVEVSIITEQHRQLIILWQKYLPDKIHIKVIQQKLILNATALNCVNGTKFNFTMYQFYIKLFYSFIFFYYFSV